MQHGKREVTHKSQVRNGSRSRRRRCDRFQTLRAMLLAVRKDLLQRARSHALAHSANGDPGDEGDHARTQEEMELNACLSVICASELADIDGALRRLQEGRYGICEECGEEIPIERLKLMPAALLCVDCRSAEERERRRNAGPASIRNGYSSYKPGSPSRIIDDFDDD